MVRIAVDAMGGDNAPQAIVEGCLAAVEENQNLELLLVGRQEDIDLGSGHARIRLIHAPDVITNHESPTLAVRRKVDSSLVRAVDLVKKKEAQGFVSAGSTGAVLTAGIFRMGRIRGISRPALAPLLPTATGKPVMLIDCGANVDCKPEYLAQFGLMGSAYMENVIGVAKPKVALINIGAETEKGNDLVKAAYGLLEAAPIHFTGNIEARDLLSGDADVLVCDGFSGNLILKFLEGCAGTLMGMLKDEMLADTRSKMGAMMLKPALRRFKKKMDYSEYGGAPLLGVQGAMAKAHGSSNGRAIAQAIAQVTHMIEGGVTQAIQKGLEGVQE